MSRPLRIFLLCQQDLGGPPHPVPAYRFWRHYLADALGEAGHQILEAPGCDWAAGLLPLDRDARALWLNHTWERALAWLRAEHSRTPIDLLLSYLYPEQIHPHALADIRALGVARVNFFCDNVREFRRPPREFSAFDLHWVPEYKALPIYRRAGLPCLHAAMPCHVPANLRLPPDRETEPVSFIGTRDPLRAALFAQVAALGLDVDLWGVGWREPAPPPPPTPRPGPARLAANQLAFVRQHGWSALARKIAARLRPPADLPDFDPGTRARGPLDAADYTRITRESAVCLGVNRYPSPRHSTARPDTYSRLRDIEAPMMGACYLTEWTEGLDLLYTPGVEIETYHDSDELVAKTRALQADPSRRARLRAAGQRRALAAHTPARTLLRIATELGLG